MPFKVEAFLPLSQLSRADFSLPRSIIARGKLEATDGRKKHHLNEHNFHECISVYQWFSNFLGYIFYKQFESLFLHTVWESLVYIHEFNSKFCITY